MSHTIYAAKFRVDDHSSTCTFNYDGKVSHMHRRMC